MIESYVSKNYITEGYSFTVKTANGSFRSKSYLTEYDACEALLKFVNKDNPVSKESKKNTHHESK